MTALRFRDSPLAQDEAADVVVAAIWRLGFF
jgi:hypothetical protein